jgi:uncharacterized protein YggE
MTHRFVPVLTFIWVLAFLSRAYAQPPSEGAVTGQGIVELKRQPDTLRFQIEILARGKDLKEALSKLKERREAARQQVLSLGAVKESIEFGEPSAGSGKSDRQREMERMVGEKLGRRVDKKGAKPKAAPSVVVSAWLKADLSLKAETTEDLLVLFDGIQEKIKAADLGGMKEFQKMSPEDEELAEENLGGPRYSRGEDEPRRGEPTFMFVRKISEADRDKALAEAFGKAKKEAARLARAAEAELGALQQLGGQNMSRDMEDFPGMYDPYYSRRMLRQMRDAFGSDGEQQTSEAIGAQPGKVVYRVMVSASFTLKAVKR